MSSDDTAISVCVRVRPLNPRERGEGHRSCVLLDDETRQVVLTAVDKSTLIQLKGSSAKGYAFDRRFDQSKTSDDIYDEVVSHVVEKVFKGFNGTVLAYGQTGAGKTHTMSGGAGIHGTVEEGVTPRVIRHIFSIVDSIKKKAKPGEKVEVAAYALELYNEDLLDLSLRSGRGDDSSKAWGEGKQMGQGLKISEKPVGKEGRVVPEVVGVKEIKCASAADLKKFYDDCMSNRSVSSTKLNDASSRSHAIFTITVRRTMVDVSNEVGADLKAKVVTSEFESKLHLVDLAGSERVKRSGVTGKELKEATNINGGLLVLGNVIVALSSEVDGKKKGHIPYRDSKLTRLLCDSLGGNSYTVLISCISPSEMDFEETNNTLKYANRACHIKNTPIANKFTTLEEDLLPSMPMSGGMGMIQIQALLEDHERQREVRERKLREKQEKDAVKQMELLAMRDAQVKKPGYQRLRQQQYDELRKQVSRGGTSIAVNQVIGDDLLKSFGNKSPANTPKRSTVPRSSRAPKASAGAGTFSDWLTAQEGGGEGGEGTEDDGECEAIIEEDEEGGAIIEDDEEGGAIIEDDEEEGGGIIEDDEEDPAGAAETQDDAKSKFRRKDEATEDSVVEEAPVEEEEAAAYDPIEDDATPKLLARFKVNVNDVLSVFKASSPEDFKDVMGLLPQGTPLPASGHMTYLLARLESGSGSKDIAGALARVAAGQDTMNQAVGPAVGCLMASFGTNMISSCIFEFQDPEECSFFGVDERIELWGLQIPHNSARPALEVPSTPLPEEGTEERPSTRPSTTAAASKPEVVTWTSVDRLNMSIGLLYALTNHAVDEGIRCGFCVPRPQLLRRWLQAGVNMKQITGSLKLVYPPTAHDFEYYKASTVAFFMVDEVKEALHKQLSIV